MSLLSIVFICLAGFFGAVVDAIVGGGGLITMPALLAVGFPIHLALGTNKFAAVMGTFSSSYHYYKSGNVNFKLLKYLLPFSAIGSALGVLSVLALSPDFLRVLIIFLVLIIGTYTFIKKDLGMVDRFDGITKKKIRKGTFLAFPLGFYDGFFGPGTGAFIIFGLVSIFGFDFKKASANAKLMNLTSNLMAFLLFLTHGKIMFEVAIPMAICMAIGGKVGSQLAIKKGATFIKPVFIVVSFALVIKMIFDLI
ncbi:TSUP family transporter [Clostridiaceae bacterium HSG29]|nr:TSUP family transporter [Clostridiaceae bacterium HSG29]